MSTRSAPDAPFASPPLPSPKALVPETYLSLTLGFWWAFCLKNRLFPSTEGYSSPGASLWTPNPPQDRLKHSLTQVGNGFTTALLKTWQASGGRQPPEKSAEATQGAHAPRSPEDTQGAHARRSPGFRQSISQQFFGPALSGIHFAAKKGFGGEIPWDVLSGGWSFLRFPLLLPLGLFSTFEGGLTCPWTTYWSPKLWWQWG
jgi:hypothetical protein